MDTQNKLYGAWITLTGDLIPVVETFCHMETAQAILRLPEERLPKKYSLYQVMGRLGYIRLTFGDNDYIIETIENQKTTKEQESFLNTAVAVCPAPKIKLY